jgi:hypothetical protein
MRALLLIIMIALLPLRGWASEVMATEMASSQVTHTQKYVEITTELGLSRARIDWSKTDFDGQNDVSLTRKKAVAGKASATSAMPDCEGHAKADASVTANTDTDAQTDSHCNTCPACQACHTVALSAGGYSLSSALLPRMLPRPAADHFASAAAALVQKPPIS